MRKNSGKNQKKKKFRKNILEKDWKNCKKKIINGENQKKNLKK